MEGQICEVQANLTNIIQSLDFLKKLNFHSGKVLF
jgi:hypothetical protein